MPLSSGRTIRHWQKDVDALQLEGKRGYSGFLGSLSAGRLPRG